MLAADRRLLRWDYLDVALPHLRHPTSYLSIRGMATTNALAPAAMAQSVWRERVAIGLSESAPALRAQRQFAGERRVDPRERVGLVARQANAQRQVVRGVIGEEQPPADVDRGEQLA